MQNRVRAVFAALSLASIATVGACGGGGDRPRDDATSTPAGGAPSVAATGDTIVVEMITDGTGNFYRPSEIEAEQGDVIRFTLVSGVHNVNFVADSNSIKTGLPAPSDMLQLPGQTYDLVVTMQKGEYYFHCDPHAALGMKGKLEVED